MQLVVARMSLGMHASRTKCEFDLVLRKNGESRACLGMMADQWLVQVRARLVALVMLIGRKMGTTTMKTMQHHWQSPLVRQGYARELVGELADTFAPPCCPCRALRWRRADMWHWTERQGLSWVSWVAVH